MRAISPHANYSIQIRSAKVRRGVDQTGQMLEVVEQEPLVLQFEHFAVTPEEASAVLQAFSFSGLAEGVNPLTVLGVWDSEIYKRTFDKSDAEMQDICETLRRKGEANGWRMFIIVDEPRAPKPWPTYDEDSEDDIIAAAQRFGFIESVIQYESENEQREEILTALGVAPPEALIEVSV
jgi:hypothetical protein